MLECSKMFTFKRASHVVYLQVVTKNMRLGFFITENLERLRGPLILTNMKEIA